MLTMQQQRAALCSVVLLTVVGVTVPLSRSAASPAQLTASTVRNDTRIVSARHTTQPSASSVMHVTLPPSPTPAPTPTPTPPPAPPPPPPFGGLHVLQDPVLIHDASHGRTGVPPTAAISGVLLDADTHAVLWDFHAHQSHAPASTTKLVSALVALENFDAHKRITITPDALTQAADETRMGLKPGETYDMQDLLSGMMTVSANDAATAMGADTVGLDNFVGAMNAQIQALGLRESHFTTPVGLDDPQQYASAYDLAVVGMEDWMRFPLFRAIVAQQQIGLPATATHPEFLLPNLNRLLQTYPAAVGLKPGWTGNAGACLVGMAVRNGHHLIVSLQNDPDLYFDARNILEWGFGQYGLPPI